MSKIVKPKVVRMNGSSYELAVGALCRHALADKVTAMIIQENNLAEEVLAEFVRPNLKAWKATPKEWISSSTRVGVNANGWKIALNFVNADADAIATALSECGMNITWPLRSSSLPEVMGREVPMPRPLTLNRWDNVRDAAWVPSSELGERLQAHVQAKKGFIETANTVTTSINQTVRSFKTANDLIDAIPELKTLAPDLLVVTPTTALVPSVERMMCQIASMRDEARDGCTAGVRDADLALAA